MPDTESLRRSRRTAPLLPSALLITCIGVATGSGIACNDLGAHAAVEVDGADCVTCHRPEFEAAVQPLHVQQLPLDCGMCHANDTWHPARGSDHQDYFPLHDAHAELGCGSCHQGAFGIGLTPKACIECHERDYALAARPPHDGLPTDCGMCHNERAFSPATFEHNWPLSGEHAAAACASCHGDPPTYEGTEKACVGCHRADYDAATDPPHDGFATDCQTCHAPTGWRGASVAGDPSFMHPWPLVGSHESAPCAGCHGDSPPVYAGTSSACVDCHRDDYERATAPSHDGFSTECSNCHTPHGWQGAVADDPNFMHPWPLRGAHGMAACTSCHVGNPPVYAGTTTACVDCHADDRDGATPSHDGLSSNCQDCHTETSFRPATFDHPMPLTGAHASATCAACHNDGYAGTPSECVDCHRDDYDRSPYPGHDSFSTDCMGCHSTSAWTPASGGAHPDNRFPISGRHNYACNDCHNPALGPNGRGNADCVGCHTGTHSRGRMDAKHAEVRNYPRGTAPPNFCLDCHPSGRGD